MVLVLGACGGLGSSTLAALLARESVMGGGRVALVDLDHGHGGLDVLLGTESLPGARWRDLHEVRGTVSGRDLEGVLPRWEGVEVLSAGRGPGAPPDAAVAAVWSGLVAGCGTVVADLPGHALPGSVVTRGGIVDDAAQLLVVTGQDLVGVAAGLALRPSLGTARTGLVLRRRRGARLAPPEIADALGIPLRGMLPDHRGVAGATDRGLGPVVGRWSRLGRAVRRIAREVADG